MRKPKKGAECTGCLKVCPLLMPVRIYPGSVPAQTIYLCMYCRTGWRDSEWVVLASTLEHSKARLPQRA